MISYEEALARLLKIIVPLGSQTVRIEHAAGRYLAIDLESRSDIPPFACSSMDGYAIRCADVAGHASPHRLRVAGESAAGHAPDPLATAQACRIFTGAPMPEGADAVIMQEDVRRDGEDIVFDEAPSPGQFCRQAATDVQRGETVLHRGDRLTPGRIALAASVDAPELDVFVRPRVAVVGSGDELRRPGSPARPASIVESNTFHIAAHAEQLGASATIAPFLPDDMEALTVGLSDLLDSHNLVVTIGGVSVGDRDLIRPALEKVGVEIIFHRVAIKPGKPLLFGRRGASYVLGLPGNPASAAVTFQLFGETLLKAMTCVPAPTPSTELMRIRGSYSRTPGRMELVRARIVRDGPHLFAELNAGQASGSVTSLAHANALVFVPANQGDVMDGSELEVLRLCQA